MVTVALDQITGRYRLEGFNNALAETEIPYNENWIFKGISNRGLVKKI